METIEAAIKGATDLIADQLWRDEDDGSVEGNEHRDTEGQADSSSVKTTLDLHFKKFLV